jgi:hypothetical protein
MRDEVLSDQNVWKLVEEFNVDNSAFEAIKHDLQMFIHGFELNSVLEPMGRVLWTITASAGVRVLAPVLDKVEPESSIQRIIRSAWMIEVDQEKGRESFKLSLAEYRGSPLLRVVVASHLLWRVFWHHYKTAGSRHLVNSAKRAIRPLGLTYSGDRIEEAKKGPQEAL